MKYIPKAVSIYLNRTCPRKCPYCDVITGKKSLSVEKWKEVFTILENKGTNFYLILASEPLMMGDDLVELVKFWNERGYEYGFYSTSPEPYFSRLKEKLKKVGIRNWSSGIDFIDEVYMSKRWKPDTRYLVEQQREQLVKKGREAIKGMQEMQDYVEETHALITISRMNIEMVPDIIKYIVDNVDKVHIGLNFVEWSEGDKMDFATTKGSPFFFVDGDQELLQTLKDKLISLPDKYRKYIQTPLEYFDNIDNILNLNFHCSLNSLAMGIDCDGSIRLCGYKKLDKKISIFDLNDSTLEEIVKEWKECDGCYWAYPYIIDKLGIEGVDYRSKYWEERLK